jgi:hypothetical protein
MEQLPILFLDIDGVLNSITFREVHPELDGTDRLDPAAIAVLNAITDAVEVEIVISSTWRHFFPLAELADILHQAGITGTIVDHTPFVNMEVNSRSREIGSWLALHPTKRFVIIDDDPGLGEWLEHLVHTDKRVGLQPAHLATALDVLRDWMVR